MFFGIFYFLCCFSFPISLYISEALKYQMLTDIAYNLHSKLIRDSNIEESAELELCKTRSLLNEEDPE
jgi:hypothetical protein